MLELRLELELGEGVDRLGDVDMVAVGDIALVGHALDDAEALLQALGKLVGRGLERCAVEGIVDVLGSLPLLALVVHLLHDGQGERRGGGVGMALAGHVLHALIESGVAEGDGGVAVVEQTVDGFALLETGAGAVLPEDGRGVGERTAQAVVAAAERAVAQLEPVFKNIPELFDVAAGGERDVGQIDGHDALIEAAVILVLARLVVAGVGDVAHARVGEAVGREEAAAAHAGIHVALELEHLLFADVIGHHAARRAFCGELGEIIVGRILVDVVLLERVDELREGGRDPHALLVLHTLVALEQHLLDDERKVTLLLLAARLVEVHEDGDEGGLSVCGQERDDLILDRLHAAADLLAQALFHNTGDLRLVLRDAKLLDLGKHLLADLLTRNVHKGREVRE